MTATNFFVINLDTQTPFVQSDFLMSKLPKVKSFTRSRSDS